MSKSNWTSLALAVVVSLSGVMLAARAHTGDPVKGKKVFLMEDTDGVSCAKCHPKGGTNNKTIRGKKVPNLATRVGKISLQKLINKSRKHLERDTRLELTDEQFNDLIAFVRSLPEEGFGDEK